MENFLAKVLFVPEFSRYHESIKSLTYVGKGAPPSFTFRKINSPIPKNKILIRILSAALNPIDLQLMNAPISLTSPNQKGIGRDFCGIVEEIGTAQKENWKAGDVVCGMFIHINGQGTVADYVCIDPDVDHIIKAPPNLTPDEAAAFPLSFCAAYRSLANAKLDSNSWVCVLGGNTAAGQFAIQLARNYYKVDKIVATASSKSDAFVRSIGADMVIDYRSATSVGDALSYVLGKNKIESQDFTSTRNTSHASEEMGEKKFRIIVDCVGGTDVLYKAYGLLDPTSMGSAYVTLVGDNTMTPEQLYGYGGYLYNPSMFGRKLLSATGLSGINYVFENVKQGDWLDKAYEILSAGTVKVIIDSVYELSDWKSAIEKLQSGKVHGKVVIHVADLPKKEEPAAKWANGHWLLDILFFFVCFFLFWFCYY